MTHPEGGSGRLALRARNGGAAVQTGLAARSGFSLLELTIVISVLMVSFLALSQSLGTSMKLNESNRDSAIAMDGLRGMAEVLEGVADFSSVFALYNDDPSDDPGGAGTAPGAAFAVPGLAAAQEDPDGLVGEIVFPATPGAAGLELREDLDDPWLGMPRDLDGDGNVDSEDHSGDYALLPVAVRLRWTAAGRERSLEILTLIADR